MTRRSPYRLPRLPRWFPLLCSAIGLLLFPCLLQAEPDPSSSASGWELLETIAREAPARQVGQPGNAWVDAFIYERFQAYAEADRPAGAAARVAAAQAAYDAALEVVIESHQNLYLAEVGGLYRDWGSPEVEAERVTGLRITRVIAHPYVILTLVGIAIALVMIAWYMQRRRALLYLAGGLAVVAVIAAALLQLWDAGDPGRERAAASQERLTEAADALVDAAEAQRAAEVGHWRHGRITHNTAAFIPGEAYLRTALGEARIHQLAPNLVEPANFPEPRFEGRIVYAGTGDFSILRALDLTGAVVLLEFTSGSNWVSAVEAGADAVIFLEPPEGVEPSTLEANRKIGVAPLSVPRFYMSRSEAAALFGPNWQGELRRGAPVSIDQKPGRWERMPVHTDWLFIPAAGSAAAGEDLKRDELVHIQTYKDAASVVPEFSPGAESAINLVGVMDLIDSFAREPPARPVLVSVVNDHSNALTGEYEFASFAFTPGSDIAEELERLDYLRSQQLVIQRIYGLEPTEDLLDYLRGAIERVAGRSFTVKEPAVNHLMMMRNSLRGEVNLMRFRIDNEQMPEATRREMTAEMEELEREADDVVKLLGLFNRFGHQTFYDELDEDDHHNLRDLFALLAGNAEREAELLDKENRLIWRNLAFRHRLMPLEDAGELRSIPRLAEAAFPTLPSLAAFNLDIGAGNDELGLFYEGRIRNAQVGSLANLRGRKDQRSRRLARLSLDIAEERTEETGSENLMRSTILGAGGLSWDSHLVVLRPFGSRAFHQFAESALTLSSVEDQHPYLFTPHDTIDRLDRTRVERSLAFSHDFLQRIVNDDRLPRTIQRRGTNLPFTTELTVRKMDRFSVEIPRTVLDNAVVLAYPDHGGETSPRHHAGQVRVFPVLMADAAGRLRPRGNLWRYASLLAFGFDDDYRNITAALDFEENERRFSSTLSITDGTQFAHRSIVSFESRKSDVFSLTHPRTLERLDRIEVLEGRNDTRPRHFSVAGVDAQGVDKRIPPAFDGTASIFMTPGWPYKLRSGNVIAIGSTAEELHGTGFPIEQRVVRNLPFVMTEDYLRLARDRINLLEARGVSSDPAPEFSLAAEQVLAETRDGGVHTSTIRMVEEARGLAFHAYQSSVQIINDLVRAVVVLLALVVPFCFFLVKLVSPYTDINRQLLLFLGVFALCTLLLYFIQPAFHVGDRPEVIILAFVIFGLALFVGSVILGKFNAAMTQAVEQSQLSESTDAPQGRLAGVAFMVGVNNMKRRRIRTTLTCATIVLVTFTILSVISVRQDPEPLRLRLGAVAPYDGFTFISPGMTPIEEARLSRMRAHFDDRARTVTRTWTARQDQFGAYMPYRITPEAPVPGAVSDSFNASILLGLEPAERNFLADLEDPEYMVRGSRWFSSRDARELILSQRSAALLGISPDNFQGRMLRLAGQYYELIGLVKDEPFEQMQDLRNLPFLPLKIDSSLVSEEELSAEDVDITQLPGVTTASTLEVAFLPVETARKLGNTSNRILSVQFHEPGDAPSTAARAWEETQRFLRYQDVYLAVGLTEPVQRGDDRSAIDGGQYAVASSTTAEVGGVLKVAVPVILAAVIILNTMLGAAMERKKEIAIYNAIGLNPTHVMLFFLAESLVFGLVGSVAGYFIGQILSIGIGHFVDINLNYSSLAVMVVIFLTIATVMLSTVYPASLAARAAVPSGQRKWSVPTPQGDEIQLKFPFSYDSRRILGICAYLDDFMLQNSEASTGKFLSRLRAVGRVPTRNVPPASAAANGAQDNGPNGETLALVYDIAPTPFDLGVNQKMEVYADYDPRVKAHMLSVHLTRESGDHDSWTTVNQPFLESLRKRLLGWRSQKSDTQEAFYEKGLRLFHEAPRLPVRDEQPSHPTPAHDQQSTARS